MLSIERWSYIHRGIVTWLNSVMVSWDNIIDGEFSIVISCHLMDILRIVCVLDYYDYPTIS